MFLEQKEERQCGASMAMAITFCSADQAFFATPNFADTYSPIVKLLHDGPNAKDHLNIDSAPQPVDERASSQARAGVSVHCFVGFHGAAGALPAPHARGRGQRPSGSIEILLPGE